MSVTRKLTTILAADVAGYARETLILNGQFDPGIELIAKPFSTGALAARIRNMLEPAPPL
jgi:hypothetical protein